MHQLKTCGVIFIDPFSQADIHAGQNPCLAEQNPHPFSTSPIGKRETGHLRTDENRMTFTESFMFGPPFGTDRLLKGYESACQSSALPAASRNTDCMNPV